MKTFTIHSVRNMFAVVIALGLGYVAYTVSPSSVEIPKAEAAPTSLSGYAWSDIIGYISFSCTTCGAGNYAVYVDPDNGDFSGHAWSSGIDTVPDPDQGGIGWISFERADTGDPPGDPYQSTGGAIAKVDALGNVTGWARALSACNLGASGNLNPTPCTQNSNAGGWDGWIKLNGVTMNPADGRFSGYAWGGADTYKTGDVIPLGYDIGDSKIGGVSVVGWVSFAGGGALWNGTACTGTNDYLGTNRCNYGVTGPQISGGVCESSNSSYLCGAWDGTASCVSGEATQYNLSGTRTCYCDGITEPAIETGTVPTTICPRNPGAGLYITNDTYCDAGSGENFTNSPIDCKPKTRFWQF